MVETAFPRLRSWLLLVVVAAVVGSCSADDTLDLGGVIITGADGSVIRDDFSDDEPVILGEGIESDAAVQATSSPDGETVVWTEVDDGVPTVAIASSPELERVETQTSPFFYLFSPDSERIAALGNDPEGGGVALLMIDPRAGSAELVDTGQPYFISWNPDSTELAAHIGPNLLTRVGIDGTRTPIEVTPGPFQSPQWLPDGRLVAVVVSEERTVMAEGAHMQTDVASLIVLDPANGGMTPLFDIEAFVAFETDPDGGRVALVDGIGPGGITLGALQVVSLDGEEPVTVAENDVVSFEWSPDGGALLYHTIGPAGSLTPHVWGDDEVTEYPDYVPTRTLISEYLPFWSQYVQTITQWSPDGTAFVYAASNEGDGVVWMQPLDGQRTRLGSGEMAVWAP